MDSCAVNEGGPGFCSSYKVSRTAETREDCRS